jgi:lysozyme family protein
MQTQIEMLLDALLKVEGGYVDDPADKGSATNFGITEATARAAGYTGDMRAMTAATAKGIYRDRYWGTPHFDLVEQLAPTVAAELFDTGVNMGIAPAVMLLQRALNVMQGTTLAIDGALLPKGETLTALRSYMAARGAAGEKTLLVLLNCFQGERYAEIVEKSPSQRKFFYGWLNNRVKLS